MYFLWQGPVLLLIKQPVFPSLYWNLPPFSIALSTKFLKDLAWHHHDTIFNLFFLCGLGFWRQCAWGRSSKLATSIFLSWNKTLGMILLHLTWLLKFMIFKTGTLLMWVETTLLVASSSCGWGKGSPWFRDQQAVQLACRATFLPEKEHCFVSSAATAVCWWQQLLKIWSTLFIWYGNVKITRHVIFINPATQQMQWRDL